MLSFTLCLSLFGNISRSSNQIHPFISQSKTCIITWSLQKLMLKAWQLRLRGGCLNFQISESYWTHVTRSATRGRYGVITTLQWGNCRPCYCCSSWTRKCCSGYHWHCSECEDGSHACSKMAQGTIKQVTRQTSPVRHEIKTENKPLKFMCWWWFDNFGIEKLDVPIAGFEHDY